MMPAASNKIETKPSAEALDPTKQFLSLLDKKVRNIEKRKSKLDAVRAKQDAGEILEREQKEAITHYEEVIANLEFARELQKNFNQVAADIEKQQKKQAKREKMEKATCEVKRIMEVLQVQTTLDSMGGDAVRQHFKTGKFGAVVLTEDNLTALDDLYQLICPTREGEENFGNKLNVASEHVISLLEFRDRAVAGSTYKELMELIDLINGCGYFERAREAEETSAEPTAAEEVAEQKVEEETPTPVVQAPAETFPEVAESDLQNNATVQQSASDLEEPNLSHQQVLPTVVQQSEVAHTSYYNQPTTTPTPTAFQPSQTQPPPQNASAKTRPLPEIISSVRGTFSFLQDSEIELDSPHMDPAVVAAQPMMRPSSASSQLPVGFPAPPVVDQSLDTEAQDPLSLSQQSLTQSNLDYSGASQSFAQAGLSHSQNMPSAPGADNLFQSGVEETTKPTVPQQQQPQHSAPHVMLGQGRSAGEPANPPFDLPPSIPMPPTQAQQDAAQLAGEKKFTLNASATEFQSRTMYPSMPPSMQNMASQPPPSQTQAPPPSQAPHQPTTQPDTRTHPPSAGNPDFPPAQNFAQAAGDFSQVAGNFQSGNFQRGGRGGNTGTSGYRGGQRGGRGGTTAGNNMQNGFNPRPQNGTSRPGTRGGTPFQGYPPRTDYRPDGYQGYNANGFGNPAAFQKRGGAGGPGGPSFPRGGAGGNRGATGMRPGGPPRTAPPRGAGVVRGGMTNRPTNQ